MIKNYNFSDLKLRVFSSFVLLVVAFIFYISPLPISCGIVAVCFWILSREWYFVTKCQKKLFDYLILLYIILGILGFLVLNLLRYHDAGASIHMIGVVLTTITTDISAYLCGRVFGGAKPFPAISPNKTLSGYLGGMIMGSGVYVLFGLTMQNNFTIRTETLYLLAFGGLLSIGVLAGDLFESAFKRRHNVKDTGKILPGHGGLFDRFDGLLGASIVMLIILMSMI